MFRDIFVTAVGVAAGMAIMKFFESAENVSSTNDGSHGEKMYNDQDEYEDNY